MELVEGTNTQATSLSVVELRRLEDEAERLLVGTKVVGEDGKK